MAEPLPAVVLANPPALYAALEAADRDFMPATVDELQRAVTPLLKFATTFGMGGEIDVKAATTFYARDLDDLPAPLLRLAFERIRKTWQYPSLPKPAQIREQVREELADANRVRRQLKIAASKLRMEEKAQATAAHRHAELDRRKKELEDNGLMQQALPQASGQALPGLKRMPRGEFVELSPEEFSRRQAEWAAVAEENSPATAPPDK